MCKEKFNNLGKELNKLLFVEQRYLHQNFSLSHLVIETGADEDELENYFQQSFGLSFSLWLRKSRITYLTNFFYKYGGALSLKEYARFTGYSFIQDMLDDFELEKGMKFPIPMIS
ncbi:hypothetical protein [Belliella aquatica]|uniref:HTH araC/xylS-type domain-containing protein n=1 Tax=Belliella aquatica TaxID=1323734 RepID=A0ABQ1MD22_9BACT|nr:hypothetical protein [Belliella aquatica]MCH7406354.1 hypothetical protein [Belliella aquatica]GGC38120.1 hypothetical protein GCM10010993_16280 [Belliella aquatica]